MVPMVPRSLIDNACVFLRRVYRRHKRCAAVLLPVTLSHRNWMMFVPPQRCGRESACWSGDLTAGLTPPAVVLASLQYRDFAGGDEPVDAVPAVDGMHFVAEATDGPAPRLWCFAHQAGRVTPVELEQFVYDDVAMFYDAVASQLTIL